MKSILISINPKWCELISSGKKTIEVRKTRPKLPTPFKCYIYMTEGNASYPVSNNMICHNAGGKCVIGEFVCDEIYDWHCGYDSRYDTNCLVAMTCLDAGELYAYGQGKPLYGWHISDLKIYDTPKSLSEFCRPCTPSCNFYAECGGTSARDCLFGLARPPMSWCYVTMKMLNA